MNPFLIMGAAFMAVVGVALNHNIGPEWDTVGLTPPPTVYAPSAVGGGYPPDAPQRAVSTETTTPLWTGPGCREWADTALRAGFVFDDLWIVLQVMELESMCLPGVVGDNGQSYGLMQINSFWCKPSTYWPRGYLQTKGMINDCAELFDPLTNLWVAWHIASNHGWDNWTTYKRLP